jgi:hypothetical protein
MRNRGGRPAILPLVALFFTFALPSIAANAAEPATAGRAAVGDAPAAKPAPGDPPTATPADPPGEKPADGPPVPAGPEVTPPRLVPSLSHDLQFGIAVLFGDGYRMIFPYSSQPVDCGDSNGMGARVCTSRAPSFIDLQPSFGISQSWDVLVDFRLGIEKDFNTLRQLFIMPGFRYWLDTQSHVKFFTTIQLAYDASKQNTSAQKSTDFGVRNSNGLMVEIMRNFGVYAQFGETMGFVRWLSFSVDAGIGIQARVP